MPVLTILRISASVLVAVMFLYAAIEAGDFPGYSGLYPRVMASIGLLLAVVTLLVDLKRWRFEGVRPGDEAFATSSAAVGEGTEAERAAFAFGRAARYMGWLFAYLVLIWLMGAVAASGVFVAAFLRVEGRVRWHFAALGGLVLMVGLVALADAMNMSWPRGFVDLLGSLR